MGSGERGNSTKRDDWTLRQSGFATTITQNWLLSRSPMAFMWLNPVVSSQFLPYLPHLHPNDHFLLETPPDLTGTPFCPCSFLPSLAFLPFSLPLPEVPILRRISCLHCLPWLVVLNPVTPLIPFNLIYFLNALS